MEDEELLKLAREAGWSACDKDIREKLLKYGRLVVKKKNQRHEHDRKKDANNED